MFPQLAKNKPVQYITLKSGLIVPEENLLEQEP